MRVLFAGAAIAAVLGSTAVASPILATDGRIEAVVSAKEMNRISVLGEKIVSVRKIDDAAGPKMLVEPDAATGDVYIAFDGDVPGRTFTAYLITETRKTVQVVLSPRDEAGQTLVIALGASTPGLTPATQTTADPGDAAAAAPPPDTPSDGSAAPRGGRRESYSETLTALIRLMFNGEAPAGIDRRVVSDTAHRAGAFELRTLEVYGVAGLRGSVLSLRNLTAAAQPLASKTFLVGGVLAAAVSHENVEPGQYARVYLIEAARP